METINDFAGLKRGYNPSQELEVLSASNFNRDIQAVDPGTGELFTYSNNHVVPADGSGLVDRFSLQSVSRKVLKTFRVTKCLRLPVSKSHSISVHKNAALNSIFYGGLQTCGSVWHCPVCAAKISERRVTEVQTAIDYCLNRGGFISFVTRTVPHNDCDSLKIILDQFREAEKILKGHRQFKAVIRSFGVFGLIKVYEITVGQNGWHLHIHEIMLHDSGVFPDYEKIEDRLYDVGSYAAV